jgi:hypothetical protein
MYYSACNTVIVVVAAVTVAVAAAVVAAIDVTVVVAKVTRGSQAEYFLLKRASLLQFPPHSLRSTQSQPQ